MKYDIVIQKAIHLNEISMDMFRAKVQRKLEEGWELHGSPSYGRDTFLKRDVISQALVRRSP